MSKLLKTLALAVTFILAIVAMSSSAKVKKSGAPADVVASADAAYNAATGILVLSGIGLAFAGWGMLKGSKYEKHFSLGQYL